MNASEASAMPQLLRDILPADPLRVLSVEKTQANESSRTNTSSLELTLRIEQSYGVYMRVRARMRKRKEQQYLL